LDAKPLAELKAFAIANSAREHSFDGKREFGVLKTESIAALKALADECPACVFAAMRQTNTYFPVEHEFKLKDEIRKVFDALNDVEYAN
jgi:hypothetical protein